MLAFSPTRSSTPTTTRPSSASRNAQLTVFLLQEWNSAMSAVSLLGFLGVTRALIMLPLGCGDVEDVTTNSPGFGAESDCSIACSGDPLHLCGGPNRLQVRISHIGCLLN